MTDKSKPETLTDADLDGVQGGTNIEIGMAAKTGKKAAGRFFDEADAVKRAPGGKRVVAEGGSSGI